MVASLLLLLGDQRFLAKKILLDEWLVLRRNILCNLCPSSSAMRDGHPSRRDMTVVFLAG